MILIVLWRVSFDMVFAVLPAVSFEIILVVFFENGPNSFVSRSCEISTCNNFRGYCFIAYNNYAAHDYFFSQVLVTHEYSPSNSIVWMKKKLL